MPSKRPPDSAPRPKRRPPRQGLKRRDGSENPSGGWRSSTGPRRRCSNGSSRPEPSSKASSARRGRPSPSTSGNPPSPSRPGATAPLLVEGSHRDDRGGRRVVAEGTEEGAGG